MTALNVSLDLTVESKILLWLECTAQLATTSPMIEVPFAHFPLWIKHVGADRVALAQRLDGRVSVTITDLARDFDDPIPLTVSTAVDSVIGIEVPPASTLQRVFMPLDEWWRLEVAS